ncbi:MAG TPA: type II secretion system F family protein, partial [Candidatus Saccharimonadia bacterium]|nr:type II secretion system F family protein [Candidatus Saccharimonadia bacterium]
MQFTYKATSKTGKIITGTAEAANKQALLVMLHKQDVKPVVIELAKGGKGKALFGGGKKKIKLQDLVVFTRQLSTMISAGVPLARSLSALQGDSESPYMREVLGGITKDVESGLTLGDAFAKYPNVFSDVYVNMVRAGEEGGILDDILKRLATQVEQDASIRKKIKSAMMYPMVILTVTIVAFFGIMLFIVPKLGSILVQLGGPHAQLPIYTRVLLNISNFCKNATIVPHIPNLILIALILGGAAAYGLKYIKTEEGKYKFHALLLRV